jgi:hypothetical protein
MNNPGRSREREKPHHMHALTKASATHLLNEGHIDRETHREIVRHAERGMKAARKDRD